MSLRITLGVLTMAAPQHFGASAYGDTCRVNTRPRGDGR